MIVIGGGDTGADCIGTSLRHGCNSVVNFELLDRPPAGRAPNNPWPEWPRIYRVDYSHAEWKAKSGHDPREYNVMTKEFVGENGRVTGVKTVQVDWSKPGETGAVQRSRRAAKKSGPPTWCCWRRASSAPSSASPSSWASKSQKPRGNWETFKAEHGPFATTIEGVFAAGDCRRGQSLVVWAINEGRGAARAIDAYLMGASTLPAPGITQGLVAVG